jgi:putative DNA primase/helicase
MNNHIDQFRRAIQAAGMKVPAEIHDDKKLHRFSTNGKRGDDSGWYVLYSDGVPAGAFGCWRSGFQSSWCAKSDQDLTDVERQAILERRQAMQRQREAEQGQIHAQAKVTAAALLTRCEAAVAHPYLSAKGIKAYGARSDGERLVIPMRDVAGVLHSVQTKLDWLTARRSPAS